MESVKGYKIARPNGWDFYTGATVNYRKNIGKIVKWSDVNTPKDLSIQGELRSALRWPLGVNTEISIYKELFIHKINFASASPNDCWFTDHFVYATSWEKPTKYPFPTLSRSCDVTIPAIDCSAYEVDGIPVYEEKRKWGFEELKVVKEIKDLDSLFEWKYSEAKNPINPLKHRAKVTQEDIQLLWSWASIYKSIVDSRDASEPPIYGEGVSESVFDSVYSPINRLVGRGVADVILERLIPRPYDNMYYLGTDFSCKICDAITIQIWNAAYPQNLWDKSSPHEHLRSPVYDSFRALCFAYMGSLFHNITSWKGVKHKKGVYPFQPGADLWRRGLVPSFDGSIWRLHTGKKAEVVYEE